MEEYFAKDVASELGLSQTKLIRLAMLLGSDYTEGINGIGACLDSTDPPPCRTPGDLLLCITQGLRCGYTYQRQDNIVH